MSTSEHLLLLQGTFYVYTDPEGGGRKQLQNIINCLPIDTAACPIRFQLTKHCCENLQYCQYSKILLI